MALALNNLKRVDMPLNEETKPSQSNDKEIWLVGLFRHVNYHYTHLTPWEFFWLLESFSWWSFSGVQVTANLLRSLGLFSVFWPILIMLSSLFILWLLTLPVSFQSLCGSLKVRQLQLVSPSPSPSTAFLVCRQSLSTFSFSLSFIFCLRFAETAKSTIQQVLFFSYYHLTWSSSWD